MTITLIETKTDCGTPVCTWEDETGRQFHVTQFETAVSDFNDFSYLYAHRAGFKALSATELEDLYGAIEAHDEANPANVRGFKG